MNIVKRLEHELTPVSGTRKMLDMAEAKQRQGTPPKSEVEQIANRLRITRKALDMRPVELCRVTGIATNTYSQWEKANGRPELDKAKLLCDKLGYTLDWIYRGDRSGLRHALATAIATVEIAEREAEEAAQLRRKGR